jgi:hypothetical protein
VEAALRRPMRRARMRRRSAAEMLARPTQCSARRRARVPYERFASLLQDNRGEVGEEGARIDAAAVRGVPARARMVLASGEEVVLVMEDGEWRLEGGVLGAPALRTPQDAVAALRQALLRRSLRGLERVLARQARAEIETEIARLVEGTGDPLDLRIEIQGNVALVRIAGGGEIVLVREAGEWHVSEIR